VKSHDRGRRASCSAHQPGSRWYTNRPTERCRLPRANQPAKATTVTIIGAGLGGVALVANLGLLGYRLPPARSR